MLYEIKKFFKQIPGVPGLLTINTLLFNKKSYLRSTGYLESFKRSYPCDASGEAVPWMNYPVIAFLKERLHKGMNAFEYGSGFSTQFYAKRINSVTSVEYNPFWYERVKAMVPENVTVMLKPEDADGEYCRAIHQNDRKYEMIVVDGADRVNCIHQILEHLTDDGIIILDDSQRKLYRDGIAYLEDRGFKRIHFEGLKPKGKIMDRTTIFYRDINCIDL